LVQKWKNQAPQKRKKKKSLNRSALTMIVTVPLGRRGKEGEEEGKKGGGGGGERLRKMILPTAESLVGWNGGREKRANLCFIVSGIAGGKRGKKSRLVVDSGGGQWRGRKRGGRASTLLLLTH